MKAISTSKVYISFSKYRESLLYPLHEGIEGPDLRYEVQFFKDMISYLSVEHLIIKYVLIHQQ